VISPSDASQNPKPGIRAGLVIAVLTGLALHCLSAIPQSLSTHAPRKSAEAKADSLQDDLARRISAANAAQSSGKPSAVAEANKRLLAAALRLMGQLRVSEGAYVQATELYRASLDFEPLPGVHGELAMAAQLAGNQDEALEQAKIALSSHPGDPHLDITLGRAYIAKKDYVAANRALTEASRLHPDINTLYLLATSWLAEGQPDARKHADQVFEQMKAVAGDSGSLHVLIGRAYRDAGLMPDAVKELQRAIELDPATPHAHYFLGLASLAMNEWQTTPLATAEMEKELQYHPDDYLANYMLGFLASTQHRYAAADKYLKTAIGVNPNWPEPFLYLGLDAFAEGNNQTAETMLRKAVELTGTDESRSNYQIRRAYVDLGRILAKSGRQQEADVFAAKARDLENKVMQQTQQNATAMLLAKGGKSGSMAAVVPLDDQVNRGASIANASADATARLDDAAITNSSLTPSQREAAKTEEDALRPILGQSYSDLATAEAIQGGYSAALAHYEAAERWKPDISELAKNLGQAAYKADNYPEAVRGLSKAVKENPDSMALRAMLGMSYFQTKDYANAATTFYPLGEAAMRDSAVGYAWADSLAKAGDLKDASQVLATYQSGALSNDALLLVGQLWAEIGDYDRSIATFHQILASDQSFPKVHYDLAHASILAEKWTDARAELNTQLAITPGDPDTLYYLGFVDIQESKNDDAIKHFEQVIAKRPDYAEAQYQLGKLLMGDGKAEEALPHLEAAARLSPDKDYVHYQLQAAYRRLSRSADADRELAVYQQIKAKSRADSHAAVNQQLEQKE
jgi:tetratricopeptide (TPR) repeat protein